jgi:NADP-dependent 3-hydroxy acid dehydrogenase YdfG
VFTLQKESFVKDFQGKVAVITGAASGIGKALAQKSVSAGLKVVLADIEEHVLYQTANELASAGGEVLAVVTDVSKPEFVESLAEKTFATFGAAHLLFNNAGVATGDTVWESTGVDP